MIIIIIIKDTGDTTLPTLRQAYSSNNLIHALMHALTNKHYETISSGYTSYVINTGSNYHAFSYTLHILHWLLESAIL